MLVTVSTVLDTLPNVQRFVRRNLAGGADHLVVFLDGPDQEVASWLDTQPHVTCVRAYDDWWCGRPPAKLNVRQRTNADVGRALLSVLDPDGWCFHTDGDEVVQVDRAQLAALDDDVEVLWLEPVEAISQLRWEGEVTHFKTLLEPDDLDLLSTLGVIDEPDNGAYFRGHVLGKAGMRPRLDLWHVIHGVVNAEGELVHAHQRPWARVLHYESHSGEEFLRKWRAKFAAGPTSRKKFRAGRNGTANALRTLIDKDVDPATAEDYLMRIYERTSLDDLTTLRDLGMLEEIDPDAGTHVPEPLGAVREAALQRMLAVLAEVPKSAFDYRHPAEHVLALMRRAAAEVGMPGPPPPRPEPVTPAVPGRKAPSGRRARPAGGAGRPSGGPAAGSVPPPRQPPGRAPASRRPTWRRAASRVRAQLPSAPVAGRTR